jgi:hypothetical protein
LPAEPAAGFDAFFTVVFLTVLVDFFAVVERETFDLDLALAAIIYLRTNRPQHTLRGMRTCGFAAQR